MNVFYMILLLLGAVCFLASAANMTLRRGRPDLISLGLFFWILVPLIQTIKVL